MNARLSGITLFIVAGLVCAPAAPAGEIEEIAVNASRPGSRPAVTESPLMRELGYRGGVAVDRVPGFGKSALLVGYNPKAPAGGRGDEANELLSSVLAYVDTPELMFAGLCQEPWKRLSKMPSPAECERQYWRHDDGDWRVVKAGMDEDLAEQAKRARLGSERAYVTYVRGQWQQAIGDHEYAIALFDAAAAESGASRDTAEKALNAAAALRVSELRKSRRDDQWPQVAAAATEHRCQGAAAQLPAEPALKPGLRYPVGALNVGMQGAVILSIDIDDDGLVRDVKVVEESPPSAGFSNVAVKAAKRFLYFPACQDGAAVAQADRRERLTFTMNR